MANYNIVVTPTNFSGYSLNEMLAPVLWYNKDYDAMEEKADKYEDEYGNIVLPDGSMYKQLLNLYNQAYSDFIDDFSKGLDNNVRRKFRLVRQLAKRNMEPIKLAKEAYDKDSEMIRQLLINDPTTIIGYNDRTIDDYYNGAKPDLGYRNGKLIMTESAAIVQGLDNALLGLPKVVGDIAKLYFILKQSGLNNLQALKSIQDALRYNNINEYSADSLVQALSALDKKYNNSKFNLEALTAIRNSILQGAIMGIQAPKYSTIANGNFETPTLRWLKENAKKAFDYLFKEDPITGNLRLTDEYIADLKRLEEIKLTNAPSAYPNGYTITTDNGITYTYDALLKKFNADDGDNNHGLGYTPALLQKELTPKELKEKEKDLEYYLNLGKTFKPINFTLYNERSKVDGLTFKNNDGSWYDGYFYNKWYSDNTKVNLEKFRPEVLLEIIKKIKELNPNINLKDIEIYRDHDAFSNNHYRVVIKDTSERGVYEPSTETTTTKTTEENKKNASANSATEAAKPGTE